MPTLKSLSLKTVHSPEPSTCQQVLSRPGDNRRRPWGSRPRLHVLSSWDTLLLSVACGSGPVDIVLVLGAVHHAPEPVGLTLPTLASRSNDHEFGPVIWADSSLRVTSKTRTETLGQTTVPPCSCSWGKVQSRGRMNPTPCGRGAGRWEWEDT